MQRRDALVLIRAVMLAGLLLALLEALFQGGLGIALGAMLGHAGALTLGSMVSQQSGLAPAIGYGPEAMAMLASALALSVGAGALPALWAYRLEPARVLAGP